MKKEFDKINEKFDQIDRRFETVATKDQAQKIDKRLAEVETVLKDAHVL